MRPLAPSFPDPEGDFLDHAAIERAIDDALGLPSEAQILAAERRMQISLVVPGEVRVEGTVEGTSLGVA